MLWRGGMKKKTSKKTDKSSCHGDEMGIPPAHSFSTGEVSRVRQKLLEWYNANHRQLPWRQRALSASDPNQRAYAVWVSEIMLQQTQVATVIDYYNKWMKKWPTLQTLAKASLEEVHTVWAGLGYYSRGRRLLEGAQKVVSEMNGEMPRTAESLLKALPGVGRYTAGAIASIAFEQPTGVVDGNVVRVWSRVRRIGADSTSAPVVDALWSLANQLVDENRPGDFNQSVMELGAMVCTPKSPGCAECPIRTDCRAYKQVELHKRLSSSQLTKTAITENGDSIIDIECAAESCKLCLPPSERFDTSLGVMNYPRKPKKKPPREETTSVCLVCRQRDAGAQQEFLMLKQKDQSLLAGLWEFPSLKSGDLGKEDPEVWLQTHHALCLPADTQLHHVGQIVHQFSHITQTYVIDCLVVAEALDVESTDKVEWKWMTRDDLLQSAISTAMKKIFKTYENIENKAPFVTKKRKREQQISKDGKKQVSLHSFFTAK